MVRMPVQAIPAGADRARPNPWALPAWLSLATVVYITLMPFGFDDFGLARAWEIYRSMEWPRMKSRARQEWVANVLLFMPLGFCWMAWLSGGVRGPAARWTVGVFVCLFCLVVTAGVEFVQTWLPLREPSLVDLSGNFIGGVLGVLAWSWVAPRWSLWRAALQAQGVRRALAPYAVVYILAGLLPSICCCRRRSCAPSCSGHVGWWTAADACDAGMRCTLARLLEVAMSVPLGNLSGTALEVGPPGGAC